MMTGGCWCIVKGKGREIHRIVELGGRRDEVPLENEPSKGQLRKVEDAQETNKELGVGRVKLFGEQRREVGDDACGGDAIRCGCRLAA